MIFDSRLLSEKAELAKRASHIIAVSNKTKIDIVDILKIPPEKISVVYHANSLNKGGVIDIEIPNKYFLYVGERHFYKNFLFFKCDGNSFND
jgi:hypothetical protein